MSKVYVCPSPPGVVVLMAARDTWTAVLDALASDIRERARHRVVLAAYQQADGDDVQRVTLTPEDAAVVLARARG